MKEIDFKKILIGVSLSEITQKVYPYSQYITRKFESETHLLFVARLGRDDLFSTPGDVVKIKNEVVKNSEKRLEQFAKATFNTGNVITKVAVGEPADEIIKYIEKENIDLVIMGTHGRRGIKRTFLGSVAAEVITRSPVPVVVINPLRV